MTNGPRRLDADDHAARSGGTEAPLAAVLAALQACRARLMPPEWAAVCLDALVHAGAADGGALVDAGGAVLSSVGLLCHTPSVRSVRAGGPSLILCWREPGASLAGPGTEALAGPELAALLDRVWPSAT